MSRLSPLDMAMRAARQNPAFQLCTIYAPAQWQGAPLYTAEGELQFDACEETLGYVDMSRETVLTLGPSYVGRHLVTVISEVPPNGAALILVDCFWYQIDSVHSANVLGTTITYACTSLKSTAAPVIRKSF